MFESENVAVLVTSQLVSAHNQAPSGRPNTLKPEELRRQHVQVRKH